MKNIKQISAANHSFFSASEISPKGWLRDQLVILSRGLAGNLDKVWGDVRDSKWIGGDKEGWERVPYWLDGFVPLAYLIDDSDMKSRALKYIDAILASQRESGWICPCPEDECGTYDTWGVFILAKALTTYYDCSADRRIPETLYRVMKNLYSHIENGDIVLSGWGKFRWFEVFGTLDMLNGIYGEEWITALAHRLETQGANYPSYREKWIKPLNEWTFETHIVNLAQMLKYEAVSHELLGRDYTDAASGLFSELDRYNGTAVGTFTGDECLSGVRPIQGTELCAVVELMYSYELLYAHSGNKKWAELLEKAAFNALPAALSDDTWSHQYDQMVNQIACVPFPGRSVFRTNTSDAHIFGLEPNFGCCTANFVQGWPKLALSGLMRSEDGSSLLAAVFLPMTLEASLGGGRVRVECETDYPFGNSVTYTVKADKGASFVFSARIPSFAEGVTLNGETLETDKNGIAFIGRIEGGESREFRIAFTVKPHTEKRPHGMNCVTCGPLVFSIPVASSSVMREYTRGGVERKFPYCDYELDGVSDWNYALSDKTLTVSYNTDDRDGVPFSSKKPCMSVTAHCSHIDWGTEDGFEKVCAAYPKSRKPLDEPSNIKMIPYGCAKLRMTELPFARERKQHT